ncbi:MAG: type 1 glutamine amidotransferase [Microbacteriaceae bacterium]|jgi:GMP synthase-like glutamine amidotransferase|nr:type 1 glutamine amidotransferase [Microbacteriaceae bacterium]
MSSTAVPKVAVVVNSPTSGPRRLGAWLEASGIEPVTLLGSEGLPATLEGYSGLVMLGGGFMPDDDARAPWLPQERELASQAIRDDLPTLGVCLGGQLLAQVGGGEVRASFGAPEHGVTPITPTPEGTADAVIGALAPVAPLVENHQDRITRLPEDAVLLATSERCELQAFRLGAHVRGLQFHPEVPAEALRTWDEAALAADGFDKDAMVTEALAHHEENERRSRALVEAFAAEVLDRAARDAA